MKKRPKRIVSTVPSIRYATAFVIDRLSGPRWIGIHSCCSNSVVGSNSPRANAFAGRSSANVLNKTISLLTARPPPPSDQCSTRGAAGRGPRNTPPRTSAPPPAPATCQRRPGRRRRPSRQLHERASRTRPRLRRRGYPYDPGGASVPSRAPPTPPRGPRRSPTRRPASLRSGRSAARPRSRSPPRRRAAESAVRRGAVSRWRASGVAVLDHGGCDPGGDAKDCAEEEPELQISHHPAEQRSHRDHRGGEPDQDAAGAGEGKRRSLGLHRCGAYQRL